MQQIMQQFHETACHLMQLGEPKMLYLSLFLIVKYHFIEPPRLHHRILSLYLKALFLSVQQSCNDFYFVSAFITSSCASGSRCV